MAMLTWLILVLDSLIREAKALYVLRGVRPPGQPKIKGRFSFAARTNSAKIISAAYLPTAKSSARTKGFKYYFPILASSGATTLCK